MKRRARQVSSSVSTTLDKKHSIALVVAIVVGALAGSQSLASQRLDLSQLVVPAFRNPDTSLNRLLIRQVSAPDTVPFDLLDRAARQSLRAAPLNSKAIFLLAMAEERSGHAVQASKLAELSAQTTRRNPAAQLWLAQEDVKSGRFGQSIDRLDRVMKISPDQTYPLLEKAVALLNDPNLYAVMQKKLTEAPPWRDQFLLVAANRNDNPEQVARLFAQLPNLPYNSELSGASQELVNRLVEKRQVENLRAVSSRLAPTSSQKRSLATIGNFTQIDGYPPISWWVASDANFGAAIAAPSSTTLAIESWVNPSNSGTAARKLLWLSPGMWRLQWSRLSASISSGDDAHWIMTCYTARNRSVVATSSNLQSGADKAFLTLNVPQGCPVQELKLIMRAGEGRQPVNLSLADVALHKLGSPSDEHAIRKKSRL